MSGDLITWCGAPDIWLCIGSTIRTARLARGLAQADLARAVGVSRMSVTWTRH